MAEDGATAIGERGDMRMCRQCKAGPVVNYACSDLNAHNNAQTTYKGYTVRATARPNNCPNCNWFSARWHDWPRCKVTPIYPTLESLIYPNSTLASLTLQGTACSALTEPRHHHDSQLRLR
jgi:hypothetical protein